MKHLVANGLGNRAGRRTVRLRVPKADLIDLCAALHARGLGTWSIARLTGYSQELVRRRLRDAGCGRHNPGTTAQAIIDHLPQELAAACLRVKTRSDIAHERAWRRVDGGSGTGTAGK